MRYRDYWLFVLHSLGVLAFTFLAVVGVLAIAGVWP